MTDADLVEGIIEYFTTYCKLTTLPSYDDLLAGLKEGKHTSVKSLVDETSKITTNMEVPENLLEKKIHQVQKIASHLWGGDYQTPEIFQNLNIDFIEKIEYANWEPLRIQVSLPGNLKKTLYAKPFDVRRLLGLELEHLLSPHKFDYSFAGKSIYEDEIKGLEAEEFIRKSTQSVFHDPDYVEELVKLDYRCKVMLLGDMHELNYVVSTTDSGREGYIVRPIDFDVLFDIQYDADENDFDTLVFSEPQISKEDAITVLGEDRYNAIIDFERERMGKRYKENEQRIKALLGIISGSTQCNEYFKDLAHKLSVYHNDETFLDKGKVKNMAELIERHWIKEGIA